MATKKKQSSGQTGPLSPERFVREKARTLPIHECFFAPGNFEEVGMTNVVVARRRPSGNVVVGSYLVDVWCLGVKDAFVNHNLTAEDYADLKSRYGSHYDVKNVTYEEAHNLIYGALAFAEEAGIKPHRDFGLASYILEEDTDDVPLIEYEFGRDGKYMLVVGEDNKEIVYINTLIDRLGDRFEYVYMVDDDYDDSMMDELDDEDEADIIDNG